VRFIAWLVAVILATPAAAQPVSSLALAIQAGQVGERFDGYMGFAVTSSAEVRRQVLSINIRRRNLYLELAGRRNVTAQVVGVATACQLFRQLSPGEAYLLSDNVWRRWVSGEPRPVPEQCG
jgi:uncharacterized protein YdbL (DUF1318 family)